MAGLPMGTGTSRSRARRAKHLWLAIAALALAACGASQGGAFSWLHPQAAPSDWRVSQIPSGAVLAYPPDWSAQHGDRGTATAALLGSGGRFLGYLNVTPRQGDETLSNWSSFRLEHNQEEGDRAVRQLAAASGLHFLTGRGSCVKDSYTTRTGSRFVEIACLVAGARAQSVIVGAAPPGIWGRESGNIERAIAGFRS
jgi:hypothetical protein